MSLFDSQKDQSRISRLRQIGESYGTIIGMASQEMIDQAGTSFGAAMMGLTDAYMMERLSEIGIDDEIAKHCVDSIRKNTLAAVEWSGL